MKLKVYLTVIISKEDNNVKKRWYPLILQTIHSKIEKDDFNNLIIDLEHKLVHKSNNNL